MTPTVVSERTHVTGDRPFNVFFLFWRLFLLIISVCNLACQNIFVTTDARRYIYVTGFEASVV
jgi:hypothetical protein